MTIFGGAKTGTSNVYPDFVNYLLSINDGSSGDVTYSTNTSLASGIYRYNNLTISTGVTLSLATGSFLAIVVKGNLTLNGTISVSGRGGAGYPAKPNFTGNIGGSNGGNGYGNCGSGGNGGTYGNGYSTLMGGTGGTTDTITVKSLVQDNLYELSKWKGGGGGAGGVYAGSYSVNVGASGSGGGCLLVVANKVTGAGFLRADGTAGTATSGGATSGEGGAGTGGGGGGLAVLIAQNANSFSNLSAVGGAPGSYNSTVYNGWSGTAGTAGSDGTALKINL